MFDNNFDSNKETENKSASLSVNILKTLQNHQLIEQTRALSKNEQELTLQVIEFISEIELRKIHLHLGFASMFDFVTKDLGYEDASAMRRIQAARAIREMPELKEKIADRSLSLTVVAQAQNFLRKQEQSSGQKISRSEKTDLYRSLENKSTREAEKEFFKIAPELCLQTKERQKQISENLTEVKFVVDTETMTKAKELKLLMSHQNPSMTQAEFYKLMVNKLFQEAIEKKSMASKSKQGNSGVGVGKRARYIPAKIRKLVWQRDQACCQFVNPDTQKKCQSKYQVQFDHVHPFRHQGEHSAENLRLLCGMHNRLRG